MIVFLFHHIFHAVHLVAPPCFYIAQNGQTKHWLWIGTVRFLAAMLGWILSKWIFKYLYFFVQFFFFFFTLNHSLQVYGKIHNFQYGKRMTRHSEQLCVSQSLRESLPPPSSSSLLHHCLFPMWKLNATDATEWKMKRYHGLQSTSSALPESFHVLPQRVVKQKTRSKTQKQKHQRPNGPYHAIMRNFFFFFLFLLPTKWSLGLLTEPPYIIIFTSLHQKNNSVSE